MATRFEALKDEVEQLVYFTLKLILHWLALVVILGFVLLGFWLHHLFRRAYLRLEQQQTVEAQGKKGGQPAGNRLRSGGNGGRPRKGRGRRSARKPPTVKPVSRSLRAAL
jgi:hypothetical protein